MVSDLKSVSNVFIRLWAIINRIPNLKDLVLVIFPFFSGSLNEVMLLRKEKQHKDLSALSFCSSSSNSFSNYIDVER